MSSISNEKYGPSTGNGKRNLDDRVKAWETDRRNEHGENGENGGRV